MYKRIFKCDNKSMRWLILQNVPRAAFDIRMINNDTNIEIKRILATLKSDHNPHK